MVLVFEDGCQVRTAADATTTSERVYQLGRVTLAAALVYGMLPRKVVG